MPEQHSVAVFVKLQYGEVYWTSVLLTSRLFRKVLYIFGFMGVLMVISFIFAFLRPRPEQEWYQMLENSKSLLWVFGIPILVVFVSPMLSAQKALNDERLKRGISYRFSDSGIHVESSVAKADLQWAAIRHAIETRSAFLLLPTANVAHTLPKRCFSSAEDVADTRELLRANIPKAKLHRN